MKLNMRMFNFIKTFIFWFGSAHCPKTTEVVATALHLLDHFSRATHTHMHEPPQQASLLLDSMCSDGHVWKPRNEKTVIEIVIIMNNYNTPNN